MHRTDKEVLRCNLGSKLESFCSAILGLKLSSLWLYTGCFISSIASIFWKGRRANVKGKSYLLTDTYPPLFYSFNFLFELISELQKSCKNCTKNSHILFTQIAQVLTFFIFFFSPPLNIYIFP